MTQSADPHTSASSTGDVTADRYYTFGGATVAMRHGSQVDMGASPPVTGIWYLFGDIQGSIRAMVSDARDTNGDPDPANAIINRNAYTPYGQTRGGTQLDSDRGWLGQITDEAATGLVYLNARYYDPVTSRFVSTDPLMNPTDPRTLDPYRYADNNPVSASDPSGLNSACVGMANADLRMECYYGYAAAYVTSTSLAGSGDVRVGYNLALKAKSRNGYQNTLNQIHEADAQAQLAQDEVTSVMEDLVTAGGTAVDVVFIDDFQKCFEEGDSFSCAMAATNFIPGGKLGKIADVATHLDDVVRIGDDVLEGGGDLLHAAEATAPELPEALRTGHNAREGVDVYAGLRGDLDVYTGISVNILRRAGEHGSRFTELQRIAVDLTRGAARAVEEARILENQGENIRHSISPLLDYYDDAVAWGRHYLATHPGA